MSHMGFNVAVQSDSKKRMSGRFSNLKGRVHSKSVKVHTNSFLYSPELYLSNITQNYSNIRPEAISSDRMMGGLDTVDSGPSAALRR